MKKTNLLSILMLLTASLFIFQSCSNDDDGDAIEEFVADDSTFAGWDSWTLVETTTGADPASVIFGGAHAGNEENSMRKVYIQDNQNPIDGEYPVGTLVVKDTQVDGATVMITAMAKRGNGFNPANNDWEWFVINADGSIAQDGDVIMRGANLMDGMCGGCHGGATTDYVFSK